MALQAPRKVYRTYGADYRNTIRTPIIERVKKEINDLGLLGARLFGKSGPNKLRNNRTVLPVGEGAVPILKPSLVISEIPESPNWIKEVALPESGIGESTTSEAGIDYLIAGGYQWVKLTTGRWELQQDGSAVFSDLTDAGAAAIANELQIAGPTEQVITNEPVTTTTSGSMDLGTILGGVQTAVDIYGQYKAIQSPQTVAYQPALQTLPEVGGSIIDLFTDPATGAVVPVKKKKPCRRRRKRLATKSDLGDLAALKAILGNGEAFKAWIATHSR